eukprot:5848959-Prymnesium_polylepis.1
MSNLRSGDKLGNDDDVMTRCLSGSQDAAPGPDQTEQRAGGGAVDRVCGHLRMPLWVYGCEREARAMNMCFAHDA